MSSRRSLHSQAASRVCCILCLGAVFVASGCSSAASYDDLERVWQTLLREERYEIVSFHSDSPEPMVLPTDDKRLVVEDLSEAYLWGVGNISGGGGWQITGKLEDETTVPGGVLQLYSKSSKLWSPGFLLYEGGYDDDTYPSWTFSLVLRHARNREDIEVIWSHEFGPHAVVSEPSVGERTPRGEIRYDPSRQTALVNVIGLKHPKTAEITIH